VRSAEGGTFLLDELGDLGPAGQGALLRVLQEREVLPIGGSRPIGVDVRIVAATNRDLDALAAAGTFRADLLARLSGFVFRLPPLRARREDLGLLLRGCLRSLSPDPGGVTLSQAATRALLMYEWPANVREFEKCIGAALVLATDGAIHGHHLPEGMRACGDTPSPVAAASVVSEREAERKQQIVSLLRQHGGNVSAVARSMGTARAQVHRWMRRYVLDPAAFRG
jgi:transcriptional regulator with GAF, ATPase, and Fis domain